MAGRGAVSDRAGRRAGGVWWLDTQTLEPGCLRLNPHFSAV